MSEPGFWNDQEAAQKLIAANNELKTKHDQYYDMANAYADLEATNELLSEEPDPELAAEFEQNLTKLEATMQQYQLQLLLNGKYDHNNAILEIHPVLAARSLRIGAACCCGCTSAGPSKTATKSSSPITYPAMKRLEKRDAGHHRHQRVWHAAQRKRGAPPRANFPV